MTGFIPAAPAATRRCVQMSYFCYLLASRPHGVLYVGVTNELIRRIHEHRTDAVPGFTQRYGVHSLVWFEATESILAAIQREKQIKDWTRQWKIELIERTNPMWRDLFESLL